MSDLHIADFYHDVGLILARLYSVFPRKSTVWVEDICGPDVPDEYGLHSDRHLTGFGTLLWLAEEGLIRYQTTIRQEAVDEAVLTERGFTLLARLTLPEQLPDLKLVQSGEEALPPSLQRDAHTMINLLRLALRNKDSWQIQCCVQHLLNCPR